MFADKYFNYGVIKVDNRTVWVYSGYYDRTSLAGFPDEIAEAYWSGRSIIVKLKNYHDRYMRFYDFNQYEWLMC